VALKIEQVIVADDAEEAEVGGCANPESVFEAHEAGGNGRKARPDFMPGAVKHAGGTDDAINGAQGGAGEELLSGLADDLVGADMEFHFAEAIESGRGAGGRHGVGGVVGRVRRENAVDEAEKRGGDVDLIRDEARNQARGFEDTPENVVVPIQFAGTTVGKVSESGRTGVDRRGQYFG